MDDAITILHDNVAEFYRRKAILRKQKSKDIEQQQLHKYFNINLKDHNILIWYRECWFVSHDDSNHEDDDDEEVSDTGHDTKH